MSEARKSGHVATTAATYFMFATIFMALWPLMNRLFLFGSAVCAVLGAIALYRQFCSTPAQARLRTMASSMVSALVFILFAQVQIGYNVGKYMALQDSAACSFIAQGVPNISSQRTRCARR